jgi:hypothetical protein
MTTYNMDPTSIQKEHDRLKQILLSNKYDTSILHKVNNKNNRRAHDTQKTKWAKFTYIGKGKRLITNLFKITDIKIALTSKNNIQRLPFTRCNRIQNQYDKCGIYQLTCSSCKKKYIGQTVSYQVSRTLPRLQIHEQQIQIRTTSVRE